MKKFILISAICGMLGACTAINMSPDKILLTDTSYITTISATETVRNGRLMANISGQSKQDETLYYKVMWFDEMGVPVEGDSVRSRSVKADVRSNIPFNWLAIAPNNNVASYKVYVSSRPM